MNVADKNHPMETVLTIIQGKGTLPREQAGRNIHYDDASLANYKKVEQGDFIIHLRSFCILRRPVAAGAVASGH